ncbi:MAG: helix-turn-helix domain-containing protein [Deltaproteobacteria bacterium]|nr:helix-turn-helix domain-containing protein [Deltaproteobacteria bacterium]MBF0526997.1 helix-turn-helix domain-containing protein [Deltaproteobacteria bacterium]
MISAIISLWVDFFAILEANRLMEAGRNPILELQVWMAENLREDLSVEVLASQAAMSPRNFARIFVRELVITPSRYVDQLRLEAARRQLEQTDRSLEEIAAACGFASSELMRCAFLRSMGITPGRYRNVVELRCGLEWNPPHCLNCDYFDR